MLIPMTTNSGGKQCGSDKEKSVRNVSELKAALQSLMKLPVTGANICQLVFIVNNYVRFESVIM